MNFDLTLNIDGINVPFKKQIVNPSSFPRYARVRQWHERYGMSYLAYKRKYEGWGPAGNGDPACFQYMIGKGDRPVILTPALERWIFGLYAQSCKGRVPEIARRKAYRNAWHSDKAFNNLQGWNNGFQSVILNENIGNEPMKKAPVVANGATIKILGGVESVGGKQCYPFEVMDAFDPKTLQATWENNWWTIMAATVSTYEPYPEGLVNPFPYLEYGGLTYSVPVPLLGYHTNIAYIPIDWVEFLPIGHVGRVNPYFRTVYRMGG